MLTDIIGTWTFGVDNRLLFLGMTLSLVIFLAPTLIAWGMMSTAKFEREGQVLPFERPEKPKNVIDLERRRTASEQAQQAEKPNKAA